jgi:L-fuconolactonase
LELTDRAAMSFLDAHQHVWDLDRRPQPWIDPVALAAINRSFSLADLRPLAEAAGINGTVLVQCIQDVDETREFLALAVADPLVAGVVGWTDLQSDSVADDLAELAAGTGGSALVGIRHLVQADPDPGWLTRPATRRGLAALGAAGLSFDLLVTPAQLASAVDTVAALPQVSFVLDHFASPPIAAGDLTGWELAIRPLAALPNLVAKVSGLVTAASWEKWRTDDLRPVIEVALDAFGPDRLMFGSDWPVCLLAADYGAVVDAATALVLPGLSPSEEHAFRAGTAARTYRLALPDQSKDASR